MSERTPSPLPWRCEGRNKKDKKARWIVGPNGFKIALILEPDRRLKQFDDDYEDAELGQQANARLIVRAVNSFEAMREALKIATDCEFDASGDRLIHKDDADKLRAALALAEQETQ